MITIKLTIKEVGEGTDIVIDREDSMPTKLEEAAFVVLDKGIDDLFNKIYSDTNSQ